jgi:hypothetical protein
MFKANDKLAYSLVRRQASVNYDYTVIIDLTCLIRLLCNQCLECVRHISACNDHEILFLLRKIEQRLTDIHLIL